MSEQHVEMSDIALPSPPEGHSSLLQLRRRLVMSKSLPKGCRIQPTRSSKRRIQEEPHVNPVPEKKDSEEAPTQQILIRSQSSSKAKFTTTLQEI